MRKQTIKDYPVEGRKVFLRVDFNVPLSEEGDVLDDTRIKKALPTIDYLLQKGCAIIIASHLGRPKGKVIEKLRMHPVAAYMEKMVDARVDKIDEVSGDMVKEKAQNLQGGEVLFLENVRFHPGEEKNDDELSRFYASLADVFVNDAFGTTHRAHASTSGVGKYLPAIAGFLIEDEIGHLSKILKHPSRPLTALLGGKKVEDKIGVLDNFVKKADCILVGGAMANTFMAAKGFNMGRSLVENDKLEQARKIMKEAEGNNINFVLPVDFVVSREIAPGSPAEVVKAEDIPNDMMALDIGPKTIELFSSWVNKSSMIVWNGPLGAFEIEPFHRGTMEMAKKIASSSAQSLVGGGDIVAALKKSGLADKMSHISTGGGAALEFLEGKDLPGIKVLQDYIPGSSRG